MQTGTSRVLALIHLLLLSGNEGKQSKTRHALSDYMCMCCRLVLVAASEPEIHHSQTSLYIASRQETPPSLWLGA